MMNFRTPERVIEEEPTAGASTTLAPTVPGRQDIRMHSRAERHLKFDAADDEVVTTPSSNAQDSVCCTICLSPLRKNGKRHKSDVFRTPCGHEFHLDCLRSCREYKNNTGCPLCRTQLPPGLTPVGAKERQAERDREEETAFRFNISAEYNPNYIAIRAARIRLAVAQRYCQEQQRNRATMYSTPPQVGASAS